MGTCRNGEKWPKKTGRSRLHDGNRAHGRHQTVATLEAATGIARKDAFAELVKNMGQPAQDVNDLLWKTYHPYEVWYPFVIVGICSLIGIIVFSHVSKRWKDMNV